MNLGRKWTRKRAGDHEVDPPIEQELHDQLVGLPRLEHEAHAWVIAHQLLDRRADQAGVQRLHASQTHLARRGVGKVRQFAQRALQFVDHRLRAPHQSFAIDRRQHPAATALEQRQTERVFEFAQRLRHRRFGAVQAARRLAHRAGLHHGDQRLEVAKAQVAASAVDMSMADPPLITNADHMINISYFVRIAFEPTLVLWSRT